ncbi:polyketide synthase dehydratase domain-containing protein [Thiothrix nivea]|uniref:Beta-ketoacyl synthase n=1 Tax=Thiothrix nivea (strain ATCC 35100 / DSM 5205 / JP2) TaxID=870187 RepID=A0A656HIM4_THINJ|nr:polyketide synthase dehydratase domain-containing protein [Thiothrix nivea]EIJ36307.1 beta-ketoacyl synthase [Thiothrix nivea DSM 5205]
MRPASFPLASTAMGWRFPASTHPLLGRMQATPHPSWKLAISDRLAWLEGHRINGVPLFPATGYVEMALATARAQFGGEAFLLTDVSFLAALCLCEPLEQTCLRTSLFPEDGRFEIHSRNDRNMPWRLHAKGVVQALPANTGNHRLSPDVLYSRCGTLSPAAPAYAALQAAGFGYAGLFRGMVSLTACGHETLAELTPGRAGWIIDPVQLDSGLQSLLASLGGNEHGLFLPVGIKRLQVNGATADAVLAYGHSAFGDGAVRLHADLCLLDRNGRVSMDLQGLTARPMTAGLAQRVFRYLGVADCGSRQPT